MYFCLKVTWICHVIVETESLAIDRFMGDFRWIGLHVGSSSWVCLRGCIGLRIPLGNPMGVRWGVLEHYGSWSLPSVCGDCLYCEYINEM